ncbi:50S ribosomal protein L31e [Candidatus Woesearchaeota archaeon]|nr:50S ribosomal protein L31e [Candidatus Woesearchaeota archaeon]
MANKEEAIAERTYTIPLRKEFLKVPKWRRTEKALVAVREFLQKHMKSEDVKIGPSINEYVWKHGIRNPPSRVKVNTSKDDKGVVKAELFGEKNKEEKLAKNNKADKKAAKKIKDAKVKA